MTPELDLLMFPLPGLAGMMAAAVEAAGWDGIYFADTQNLTGEVHVSLGLAAASTKRMTLATGVTNPVTRHAAVTASAIATVQAASGGRAVLGIGRGDSSLGYLGRRPASVATFEICLRQLRGYLHGESVDLDGSSSRNVWIAEATTAPVPIDVAATGPKVIALAARYADRVTFAVGTIEAVGKSPHAIEVAARRPSPCTVIPPPRRHRTPDPSSRHYRCAPRPRTLATI